MIKSLPLPTLPPVQALLRPMLLGAIGLHALILFTPFPEETKKPPEDKEAPVKITQLPTTKASSLPKLTPKVAVPKATKPALPKINQPKTNPSAAAPASTVPPLAGEAPPAPPPVRGSQSNQNENVANPFQDFPHFPASTPNCFDKGLGENCRIASANLDAVAKFYQSEPAKKGFTLQPDGEGAGAKYFQVTKGDKTLFLSLLADEPTTVVLLAPEKITDLATLKGAVVPPEDYTVLMGQVFSTGGRGDVTEGDIPAIEQFEQPQFFYSKVATEQEAQNGVPSIPMSGIDSLKFAAGQPPDSFYSIYLQADLQTIFTEGVTKLEPYGGGDLYQLKRGSTTIYMSLVPLKGEAGTIVVTWLRNPLQ
jgi:hypothetical protein